MAKPIKPIKLDAKEVNTKKDDLPGKEGAATAAALQAKQAENKEGLCVDPTIEQKETIKADAANAASMKAKLANEAEVAKETAKIKGDQVKISRPKGYTEESEELTKAVKADAEKRDKTFDTCPVTGVLIAR